jgi:hypothetical protein
MKQIFRSFIALFLVLGTIGTFAQNDLKSKSLMFHILPFFEEWNMGTFAYNDWELVPANTNWMISTSVGNPWPSAEFSSNPIQLNYSLSLETPLFNSGSYSCAKLWCDFDYKLVNMNSTGNEKLFVDIFTGGEWKTRDSLSNTGDKDWTPMYVYLSDGSDTAFKVRFRAEGVNSADILHWYVDNIYIYVTCSPPVDLTKQDITGRQVTLSWDPPDCGTDRIGSERIIQGYEETTIDRTSDSITLIGYNLYRSDNNQVTYIKLNTALITDTTYTDNVPNYKEYCYYVTSVFDIVYGFTCESDSSNVTCADVVNGMNVFNNGTLSIYPNPARDNVVIKSDFPITGVELFNHTVQTVFALQVPSEKTVTLNVSTLEPGVYFARIVSVKESTIQKITILR